MGNGPRLSRTRATEHAGIRAVTEFFETNDCVVQSVNGENDFGKDLYVDLTRGLEIIGVTCAVQVKSGSSYRTATGYVIPIDQHLDCWRDSTIPVLGVVHDPERSLLVWVNLTRHLRTRTDQLKHVAVASTSVLDRASLPGVERSIRETSEGSHPLVQLWAENAEHAREAVWDCFAIGRRDARVFKGLRASIPLIQEAALPTVVHVLASLTSHPDRLWTSDTWVEENVRRPVKATFRWTTAETIRMARAAEGEWERGTIGQDVCLLFDCDPNIRRVLEEAVATTYATDVDEAWILFCVYLHFARDEAPELMIAKLATYPEFRNHPAFDAMLEHVQENGFLAIAD